MEDLNLNRNATIAVKKISEKYQKIRRKRKINEPTELIEKTPKKAKVSTGSNKSALLAAKKIRDKYIKLRYR